MSALLKLVFITALFALLSALAPRPAFALCPAQPEAGWWKKSEYAGNLVWVHLRFERSRCRWHRRTIWQCGSMVPYRYCDWGEVPASKMPGSISATYYRYHYVRHVRVHMALYVPDRLFVEWHPPVGFSWFDRTEAPCPANSYRYGGVECKVCPYGSVSNIGTEDIGGCYCPASTYFDTNVDACLPCPAGTTSEPGPIFGYETTLPLVHCHAHWQVP